MISADSLPNIDDCQVFKADFHMHTYYSDGFISPAERVEEALNEDYDIISITDHIEYRIFIDQHPGDHNQSYKEASAYNRGRLTLIQGSELTRSMPPGHINVLFITDANQLDKSDLWEVLNEAKKQGAFFIWNHPGWKAQLNNGPMVWSDYHTRMLKEELLNGIEVYNTKSYYDSAYYWAVGKKLTLFADSDLHDRSGNIYNDSIKRPFTLVFAKDRDLNSIKAALKAGRTIAVSTDSLFCTNEQIAKRLIILSNQVISHENTWEIRNIGKCTLKYESINVAGNEFSLKPNENIFISKSNSSFRIKNLFIGPEINATIDINQLNILSESSVNNKRVDKENIEIYPSPCSRIGNIRYSLIKSACVNLSIYNILGQQIRVIDYGWKDPGIYKEAINFSNLSNGIYFISVSLGNTLSYSKLIISK